MANRTTGIIITIVAVLLCGCPGLAFLCNALFALIQYFFNYQTFFDYGNSALYWGIGGICGGIIGIIIAVVVAYFMLRKKKEDTTITNEPLPPAY